MKGFIVVGLAAVLAFNVSAGRVFDAKQDAINEIEKKFKDVENSQKNILIYIESEKKGITNVGEENLKKYLIPKSNETAAQIEKDALMHIRTAIANQKNLNVFQCIRKVTSVGKGKIVDKEGLLLKNLLQIKINKIETVNNFESDAKDILIGLKELVEQVKKEIKETSYPIAPLLQKALAFFETTGLLLGEIEISLHEPVLNREYIKMRQRIDSDFCTVKGEIANDYAGCLEL